MPPPPQDANWLARMRQAISGQEMWPSRGPAGPGAISAAYLTIGTSSTLSSRSPTLRVTFSAFASAGDSPRIAQGSLAAITRSTFSPRIFFTALAEWPRSNNPFVILGNAVQSSIPRGRLDTPSKSLPSPT